MDEAVPTMTISATVPLAAGAGPAWAQVTETIAWTSVAPRGRYPFWNTSQVNTADVGSGTRVRCAVISAARASRTWREVSERGLTRSSPCSGSGMSCLETVQDGASLPDPGPYLTSEVLQHVARVPVVPS